MAASGSSHVNAMATPEKISGSVYYCIPVHFAKHTKSLLFCITGSVYYLHPSSLPRNVADNTNDTIF